MMIGSLVKRGKYYSVVITITDDLGNKKQKWVSTKCEKKSDAQKALLNILHDIENGSFSNLQKILFCDFAKDWLNTIAKNKVEQNTFVFYSQVLSIHILPYFGKLGLYLNEIKPLHIQKYCNEKVETLSANTVRKHAAILSGILKYARKMDLVESNVVERVELPQKIKFRGSYFSNDQLKSIMACVQGKPIESVVILSAYYGLRRSEALGLKWSDIDFHNGMIYINRSRVMAGSIIIDKATKTESSSRALPLIPVVKTYLLGLKQRGLDDASSNSEYICRMDNGMPIKPDYVSKTFKRIIRGLGLPDNYRFHDLRHSVASFLLKNNMSMKEVQYWMGHCDIGTSMNIYAHLDSDMKKASANVLNGLLD